MLEMKGDSLSTSEAPFFMGASCDSPSPPPPSFPEPSKFDYYTYKTEGKNNQWQVDYYITEEAGPGKLTYFFLCVASHCCALFT